MEAVLTVGASVNGKSSDLYPLREGNSDGLILCCSDPRFQDAFYEFPRKELGLVRPAPIVIPGCTASFGVQGLMPKRWHALRNQIELLAEYNDFPRVILINHDDCKGYASLARFFGGLVNIPANQRKNLQGLAKFIVNEYLPSTTVELYQARIVDEGSSRKVRFEKVV